MKVDAKIFKGIEYIVVTDLPVTQRERLISTINHDLFIKIMIDGKIIGQCLQYKDYSNWYERAAQVQVHAAVAEAKSTERIELKGNLALNKA
jgi:hypothetical protein